MGTTVRRLSAPGIDAFRDHLEALRQGEERPTPVELLDNPATSAALEEDVDVERRPYKDRLELARSLYEAFCQIDDHGIEDDVGLWSWLSLLFFDQVCPPRTTGRSSLPRRSPGRDYRHILEPGYPNGHRHLLAGPYIVYRLHREEARLLLCSRIHVENAFHHEIASRQALISNPAIVSVIHRLYQSWPRRRPKRGAQKGRREPGSLRRFIDVVQQLEVNYDLYSMSPEAILDLLPAEFDGWKPKKMVRRGRKARRRAAEEPGPQQTIW